MSGQHTPGQWRMSGYTVEMQRMGLRIATICPPGVGFAPVGIHQAKANARLIASAPDNYACNVELAAIVRELCAAYRHPLPEASLERSDAAIAKATGSAS